MFCFKHLINKIEPKSKPVCQHDIVRKRSIRFGRTLQVGGFWVRSKTKCVTPDIYARFMCYWLATIIVNKCPIVKTHHVNVFSCPSDLDRRKNLKPNVQAHVHVKIFLRSKSKNKHTQVEHITCGARCITIQMSRVFVLKSNRTKLRYKGGCIIEFQWGVSDNWLTLLINELLRHVSRNIVTFAPQF